MNTSLLLGFLTITMSPGYIFAQGKGSNHSQNIQKNYGVTVQINVEQTLRTKAASSQLDDRGWMRLLVPAQEPSPENVCGPQITKALFVFFGTNVAFCPHEACDVLAGVLGSKIKPLISIRRVKDGVLLNAKVFDRDGNIIASLEGNKPHVNRNFASDWDRPDEHSVRVVDNHDKQVLYIRMLNQDSLYIEGNFYLPDEVRSVSPVHTHLEITKDSLTILPNSVTTSSSCQESSDLGAILFDDEGTIHFNVRTLPKSVHTLSK